MKVKKLKQVTNYPFVNMFELEYEDMRGQDKIWQFASRHDEPKCISRSFDESDAVVIVPFHEEREKLVLIKEFRVPLADYQFGFPAGLIDQGETIEIAAKRELKEETGLLMTDVLKVSPPVYSTSGLTDESITMLFANCEGEPTNQHNEGSEDISILFVSPEEAKSLLDKKDLLFDVKTWLVLSIFATNGKLN